MAANITGFTAPAYGKEVIDKLNEIIDWLNGVTDADRVVNIQVNGLKMTVTYINGDKDTLQLQDTTYPMASTTTNGRMLCTDVYRIDALTARVAELNNSCRIMEEFNQYIEDHRPDPDDDYGGGGNGGDGGDGGDDGGHGGGGGDF